jgi:hypothetical protein
MGQEAQYLCAIDCLVCFEEEEGEGGWWVEFLWKGTRLRSR